MSVNHKELLLVPTWSECEIHEQNIGIRLEPVSITITIIA
jgi:hypothetical protein